MCLCFCSSLLNPLVARDAQSGTFPFLQSDILLPPLSPHPAPCLLPRLGHHWNLHALPMSVILAPHLAASPWPSTPLGWRTPLFTLQTLFNLSLCPAFCELHST